VRANAFPLEGPCFNDRLFEAATWHGVHGLYYFTILEDEYREDQQFEHREVPDATGMIGPQLPA